MFNIMPSPVTSLKALINSYHATFSSLLTVYFKKPYTCENPVKIAFAMYGIGLAGGVRAIFEVPIDFMRGVTTLE